MATKTVGSGGNYANMAAWNAYVNTLGTLTEDEICHVIGVVSDTDTINFTANPGGAFKIRIRPAPGYEIAPGSRLFHSISGRARITNNRDYGTCYVFASPKFVVEGIEIHSTAANGATIDITNGARLARCIIKGLGNTITHGNGGTTLVSEVFACAIFAGGRAVDSSVPWYLYVIGCTIVGGAFGLRSEYDNCIYARNNVCYGGTPFYGTPQSGSSHNAHSGGTTPGTGWTTNVQINVSSSDFISLTGGSEDYRRSPTSTKLGNTGTAAGLSVDIYNQTRVAQGAAYDIGAYEYPEVLSSGSLSGGALLVGVAVSGAILSVSSLISGAASLAGVTASGGLGLAPGVLITPVLKNNAGTVLASVTGIAVNVYNVSTGALVVRKTGLASNGSGIVTISDALLAPGTAYAYEIDLSSASLGRRLPVGVAA